MGYGERAMGYGERAICASGQVGLAGGLCRAEALFADDFPDGVVQPIAGFCAGPKVSGVPMWRSRPVKYAGQTGIICHLDRHIMPPIRI